MSELYSSMTPGSWCYDHTDSKCPTLELDAFAYPYPNIPEEWCATLISDEILAAQGHLSGQSPPTTFGHPFDVVDYNDVTLLADLQFLISHPHIPVRPSHFDTPHPSLALSYGDLLAAPAPAYTHVPRASGAPFQQRSTATGLHADSVILSGSQASHASLLSQPVKNLPAPLGMDVSVKPASSQHPSEQQYSRSSTMNSLSECGRFSAPGCVLETSPQIKLRLTSYTPTRARPSRQRDSPYTVTAFSGSPPLWSMSSRESRGGSFSSSSSSSSGNTGSSPSPPPSTSPAFPSSSGSGSMSGSRTSPSLAPDPLSSPTASQSSRHICPHCTGYSPTFSRALDLTRHIRSVHESPPTAWICCGIPLTIARTRPDIPPHVLAEVPRRYEGQLMVGGCGTQNSRKDVLRRHLKRNVGRCFGDENGAWLIGNKLTGRKAKKAEASVRGTRKPVEKARKGTENEEGSPSTTRKEEAM